MVDTRRSASAKSKAKSSAAIRQRTLFDLFPAKSTPATPAPVEQVIEEESTRLTSTSTSINTEDIEEMNMAPVVEKLRKTSLEPRPLHPFFTKPAPSLPSPRPVSKPDIIIEIEDDGPSNVAASSGSDSIALIEESGSQEDPIIVETKALKPLRSSKASVSKPLAPLFAPRRPKATLAPSPSQSPEIVLLELPDEAVQPKLAPIFASRPSKATPQSSNSCFSKTKEVVAPFPNKDSQHVRGPQHVFPPSAIPYGRLTKRGSSSTVNASYKAGSLKQLLTEKDITPSTQVSTSTILLDKDTYLDTIPHEHREHPAISRFTTASQPEGSAHWLWVDKWRPTRAAEILGNEDNATYLRDWIRALELQLGTSEAFKEEQDSEANMKGKGKTKVEYSRGTKRPRTIIREVEKKRGKKKRRVDSEDEDDSWIVHDEDYFSSPAPSSPTSYDRASSPVSRPSPLPDLGNLTERKLQQDCSAQRTFTPLTNTILLAGPSGSGKTAAVYACAEELGWDVLEVYPGIGRRNGTGIDGLIGDAGKNHHVRKARTGVVGASDLAGSHYLKENEGVESVGNSMLAPCSVRQSLILLEEVDILFKDDTNFWTAVTNFIKDCRRPVICTCNGMFRGVLELG
ncbi:hypothetical protein H2248_006335 [Termitomyces sp. 'cryptogamus']|nr:hypothetical protein H2248_006335 [Termitomyces sp. 'cryptogamus']